MVEKAVSTLKVRDLLTITLTRWTSLISLTKTLPDETRRSAALTMPIVLDKTIPAPRAIRLSAKRLPPALPETRPPPTSNPLCRDLRLSPSENLQFFLL